MRSLLAAVGELQGEVKVLRRENAELWQQVTDLTREVGYWKSRHADTVQRNVKLQAQLDQGNAEIRQLKAERFGKRSEKQTSADRSNELLDPDELVAPKKKRGQQPGRAAPRRRDYSHLPTREETVDVPEAAKVCACCGLALASVGYSDDHNQIEIESFIYRRVVRRKRYRSTCTCVAQPRTVAAELPAKLLPKSIYGTSLWDSPASSMNSSDLIQTSHRTRRATIYIRQSTAGQVANNQESLRLQYALKSRAIDFGWPEPRIDIVDCDLGQSGSTVDGRLGFQQLIEEVALDQIGILIAYDATRLARNCAHWYQLLDLCGRTNCLIADRDGVYDPSSINGRLHLGLKGQISELELHTLRARLNAGLLCKAKRGDLALMLPAGLERYSTGEVVKTANIEVQDRLTMIFQLMLSKRTIPRVMRELRTLELRIPRRDHFGDIQWREPTTGRIANLVRNPAYAGAFAYGKSRVIYENGRAVARKRLAVNQWKILVKDRYPAYVSWDDFERIGAMLSDNHSQYSFKESRGLARDGSALLLGIAYCGNCGRKMTVQYKPRARYSCTHRHSAAGEPTCQHVWSKVVDENVLMHFFQALSTAEIDLSEHTLQEADKQRSSLRKAQQQQIERLCHAAYLACRQYNHSAPENRLVTAELERRWEDALRELRSAEELLERTDPQKACWAIPADLLEILGDLGPQLPKLWESGHLDWARKNHYCGR